MSPGHESSGNRPPAFDLDAVIVEANTAPLDALTRKTYVLVKELAHRQAEVAADLQDHAERCPAARVYRSVSGKIIAGLLVLMGLGALALILIGIVRFAEGR